MEKGLNDVIRICNDFVWNSFEVEKSLTVWLTKWHMCIFLLFSFLQGIMALKNIRKRSQYSNFKKLEVLFLEKMDDTPGKEKK